MFWISHLLCLHEEILIHWYKVTVLEHQWVSYCMCTIAHDDISFCCQWEPRHSTQRQMTTQWILNMKWSVQGKDFDGFVVLSPYFKHWLFHFWLFCVWLFFCRPLWTTHMVRKYRLVSLMKTKCLRMNLLQCTVL